MVSMTSSASVRSLQSSVVPVTAALLDPFVTEGLPRYAWRGFLHALAVERGASHYQDPITNDLVATAPYLAGLPSGHCRHLRERHCPHDLSLPAAAPPSCSDREPVSSATFQLPVRACGDSSDDDDDERTTTTLCTNSTHDTDDDSDSSVSTDGDAPVAVSCSTTLRRQSRGGRGNSTTSRASSSIRRRRGIEGAADPQRSAGATVLPPYLRRHGPVMQATDIEDVDQLLLMPRYCQHAKLHQRATELGFDCYRDLNTGCVTFTRRFLLQGPCCGEDCRHCPYGRHRGRSFVSTPPVQGSRATSGAPVRVAWSSVPHPRADQGYSSASTSSTSDEDNDDNAATSTDSVTSDA